MKKIMILLIVLLLIPVLVNAESNYLYDVLKEEAENNGVAREYNGEHHDSYLLEPTKNIYHWYAENEAGGNLVLTKNNVIFADHCWQIIRTTDTGGVKLLYNGEVENGSCLDTRTTHVGYTNGVKITDGSVAYFAKNYTYNNETGTFKLSPDGSNYEWNDENKEQLSGYYTCNAESVDECQTIHYVLSANYRDYYDTIGISKNSSYFQYGTVKYNKLNNSASDFGYMYNEIFPIYRDFYNNSEPSFLLGESYTYSNGYYSLVNTMTLKASKINSDNKHRYYCIGGGTRCQELAYVTNAYGWYYNYTWQTFDNYGSVYYYKIKDGKNFKEEANKTFLSPNVNKKDSIAKTAIDLWYEGHLLDYDKYIEDTIYCNNRNAKYAYESWQGITVISGGYSIDKTLDCSSLTDQFSVNNEYAKLKYKIGLITANELALFNHQSIIKYGSNSRYNGYWTMSPWTFGSTGEAFITVSYQDGTIGFTSDDTYKNISTQNGLRPVISLKKNLKYEKGNGSKETPYVVDLKSLTYDIEADTNGHGTIEVVSSSRIDEEVTVSVNPEEGYVLGELLVITDSGEEMTLNESEYTTNADGTIIINSKFVMPSDNITVLASFKKENPTIIDLIQNPETRDNILLFIAVLIISSTITIVLYKKEKSLV